MGMSIGGGDDEPMMDINMTPLIDVMLVLLIMFIITIPVMTHAVKLDMPRASNAPSTGQPVVINLEIDFDGTVLWNGTPVEIEARWRGTSGERPRSIRSRSCTSARASVPSTTSWPGCSRRPSAMACARSGSSATNSSCSAGRAGRPAEKPGCRGVCPGGFLHFRGARRPRFEAD
jgi:hypothetical protein